MIYFGFNVSTKYKYDADFLKFFILKVRYLVMKPVQRKVEKVRELPWTEFGQVSEVAAVHDFLYRLYQ